MLHVVVSKTIVQIPDREKPETHHGWRRGNLTFICGFVTRRCGAWQIFDVRRAQGCVAHVMCGRQSLTDSTMIGSAIFSGAIS